MKSLNQLIRDYTCLVQQGETQLAYKVILDFLGELRACFTKRYPQLDIGNVYQGYMDMSYFSLSSKALKDKGLKIAIVYLHDKGHFEAWLSARNRAISKEYGSLIKGITNDIAVFHDESNQDAIMEYTLTTAPDFENQGIMIDIIFQGVEKFISSINNLM